LAGRDGARAYELFQQLAPEVVLLDLGMPGINGFDVARRIRSDQSRANTVIVAVTGWGQAEDRERTREAGFDYHLTKPVDAGAIFALLTAPAGEPASVDERR
jgi:CheY-like chemotaxis protein